MNCKFLTMSLNWNVTLLTWNKLIKDKYNFLSYAKRVFVINNTAIQTKFFSLPPTKRSTSYILRVAESESEDGLSVSSHVQGYFKVLD